MPCFSPLHGWYAQTVNPSGRRGITFSRNDAFDDRPIDVPCGYCIGCRLDRARQWTIRCMHEASQYDDNCFLTLTYADDPYSLNTEDIQGFFKRLRSRIAPQPVRYIQVGEYGESYGRPHHHAILFGYRPDDLSVVSGGSYPLFASPLIAEAWGNGHITVGDVSADSIAYVCRYTLKKLGVDKRVYDGRKPEFITMSRRPGIGHTWMSQFGSEVARDGTVLLNGHEVRAPRYYDEFLAKQDEKILLDIKKIRAQNAIDKSPTENYISDQVARIRQARKTRSFECI